VLSSLADVAANADWVNRYLALLGLDRELPSLAYLHRLTASHLSRVPFENVTSILRRAQAGRGPVPALDRQDELQAWTERRGGGLCFEVADMFGTLLWALGFRAQPVLATISFVGSHQALRVDLDGSRYLVDAGNGAPFFEPIPLADSRAPVEVSVAGLSYRFRPLPPAAEQSEALIQDRLIDGAWRPFCTYDLTSASESARELAFQRHHIRGQSWVVDNLTLIRCIDGEVWSLRDDRLTHYTAAGKQTETLVADAAYCQAAAQHFNLPAAPIEQALAALRRSP
jgi:N-hydroxyarylamine O-acetyltransferase